MTETKTLPLDTLHRELGGKMVPFAGYAMPVQFPMGVKGEHLHTRSKVGLFDVSHMGQAWLCLKDGIGTDDAHERIAAALEAIVPGEIKKLGKGRMRYTLLLNDHGGILDDLMVTRPVLDSDAGRLFLVVNAAVKDQDFAYLQEQLGDVADLFVMEDRGLLAVQGPKAHLVIDQLFPGTAEMPFMSLNTANYDGEPIMISRCGYTGEDGYELSVSAEKSESLARALLAYDDVAPIGLGARDSLRLEVGLCLYGHDMDATITPIEAGLNFALGKRRRLEGGFLGYDKIKSQLDNGPEKLRVGISPEGRAPAREGVEIQSVDGAKIGVVTSGGFGPTADAPIAMGYVNAQFAEIGTLVHLLIRDKAMPARIAALPFVPQNYYRGKPKSKGPSA